MKITIDKVQKTVTVHESENIAEVIDFLTKAGIDLKEYKLVVENNNVFIPYPVYPTYPVYPQFPTVQPYQPDWTYGPGFITY